MAAIYDEKATLDINKLSVDLKEHLATYAVPRFIRILSKIDLTGIFVYISLLNSFDNHIKIVFINSRKLIICYL